MTPTQNKSTKKNIYIDADEEITGVIDKVVGTKEPIIALVVPKRATVFTSIVNMKLLKRSATQNNKKLVLITSDKSILPLAGTVGLHVASSPTSKPYVPSVPKEETGSVSAVPDSEVEIDNAKESLAGKTEPDVESVEVDNSPKVIAKPDKTVKKLKKDKHGSKLKVPDFNKFRVLLLAGALLLIGLIIFGYWALAIAPKAVVSLRGDTETKDLAFLLKADTNVTEANLDQKIIPSVKKEIKKTETETVPATGQKDNGNKASGTVSLKNCSRSDGTVNIPAGTGVSAGGLTYITQEAVALASSIFTGGGSCISGSKEVSVIAQLAGDKYNVSERSYTVAGFSSVQAKGSDMTGGTSQIVKVVSASDIESAKTKINEKQVGAGEELKASLTAEGFTFLESTLTTVEGDYVPAPAVDTESNTVTVTVQKTYTMVGMKTDELKKLIEKLAFEGGIDKARQSILDDGLKEAVYQLGATDGAVYDVNVSNKIVAGPQINQDTIKQEIAGKKRGEAEQYLMQRPGVKEVRIETSPFWNTKVPKKVQKIQLNIQDVPNNEQQP